ncbi:MAG TPA: S41 family peptidase [Thermoanaerobaculia bacterium]|nr:S41 family peptidase [Thermoanaerobaculia bacterium]
MKKSWRILATLLFAAALLIGGSLGDDLVAMNDEMQIRVQQYTDLIQVAKARYGKDVTFRDLVYASIHGMLRGLDPHTSFLSREAYAQMRERQQSSFYGLGIWVGMRNGQLTVITPIPGTPAHQMGMRSGDIISKIDGEPTDSMDVDDAISKLKGPKDTTVVVTLVRPGLDEPLDLEVTRAEIPQNTVRHAYMIAPGTGYLSIFDFSRSTGGEVARGLEKLRQAGMERLILDLRGNGGGLLDQAIEVADQFVPENSTIVETRGRIRSSFSKLTSSGTYRELGLPLIVLVNGGSASASEILAGAIQDHDVGLIVGEPTWGKGLVQTVYNLQHGDAGLAITTARYYTPSGRLIQRDYASYWDYYTSYDSHTSVADLEQKNGEHVYYTDLGRKVYGGGGIIPDVQVDPKEIDQLLVRLNARSAIFTYSLEWANDHPVADTSWQPPEEMIQGFRTWIVDQGYADADEAARAFADPEVATYVRNRMRYEIFNSLFGLEEGHQALSEIDEQIQKAFALFDEATALLDQRHGLAADQRIAAARAEDPGAQPDAR